MAALSIGSFGDILATAQLAYKLSQILSESVGSSMEYQELIIELDALGSALRGLDDIVNKLVIQQSVRNAIEHALCCCRKFMTVFLDRIKNYEPALRKGGSGHMWRDNWRKIGWHIFRKDELKKLKKDLAEQKATINMVLSMSHCDRLEELARITSSTEGAADEKHRELLNEFRSDATRQNQIMTEAFRRDGERDFNVQGYMDEFSKALASEVRMLLQEIGNLREEKRTLQL
ncbi:hypothetical protein C8R47DRAFT_571298 [Mycena vitilis]|nr:hypothetical protein C8R47DRAFT_571298 [Mycena vitilis]